MEKVNIKLILNFKNWCYFQNRKLNLKSAFQYLSIKWGINLCLILVFIILSSSCHELPARNNNNLINSLAIKSDLIDSVGVPIIDMDTVVAYLRSKNLIKNPKSYHILFTNKNLYLDQKPICSEIFEDLIHRYKIDRSLVFELKQSVSIN